MDSIKIIILFHFFLSVKAQNSSDCIVMYKSNQTDQKCLNSTDCCYYEYEYNGKTYQKCLLKLNINENICKNFSKIVNILGGSWTSCSCDSKFLKLLYQSLSVIVIFILFLL